MSQMKCSKFLKVPMAEIPLLMIQDLRKVFPAGRTGLWGKKDRFVHALDGVSFNLEKGDVLALVGESGCGKSTLALTLMGLEHPSGGQILMEGKDITHLNTADLKELRRNIQMVFQDPYESLNPLMTVRQIVAEPLGVHNLARSRIEREQKVCQALEDAGLKPVEIYLDRLPHELSGGQRQRVVIAAALVLEPRILLADEPVSMLDVSIRAEILNLLIELRQRRGISVLFITHDLATAAYLAERVAVMYLGRIVEIGPILEVLAHPAHPYTKALLSVIPIPNPRARRERVILQGAPPNPIDIPSGCRFHPRCPVAIERCSQVDPRLEVVSGEHQAACILLKTLF
jgi:oligopeptide/dipeptide ABC transporter ATP-binding protein